jgi:hypothetical protein
MEFIDLMEQYRCYQAQIDQRIHRVLNHHHFIMSPEIADV